MLPQQPCGAYLKPVAGPDDAQEGFLVGRLEGPFLLEFVLQLRGGHGSAVQFVHLPIVYMSSIGKSSLSLAVFRACWEGLPVGSDWFRKALIPGCGGVAGARPCPSASTSLWAWPSQP